MPPKRLKGLSHWPVWLLSFFAKDAFSHSLGQL